MEAEPHGHSSLMSIYCYTFNFDTFKSVIFRFLQNDYLDHFDTFGENFDFETIKNDTFENDTFESV